MSCFFLLFDQSKVSRETEKRELQKKKSDPRGKRIEADNDTKIFINLLLILKLNHHTTHTHTHTQTQ